MTKIAFISSNGFAPWGGSEELWFQTALRMQLEGFTVGVNVKEWNPNPKPILELHKAGCVVSFRKDHPNRFQRLISKLSRPEGDFIFLDKFCPELVVISQGGNCDGISWMQACIARNLPFVIISQAASESLWPNDQLAQDLAEAYSVAKCSYFVSLSNLLLTQKQIAITLKDSKVIANPFKVSYDTSVTWPSENQIFKLACVARLDPFAKGQDLLFELLNTDKWRNRPIEISLFGSGENQKSLYKLKQLWDIQNVKFQGFIDRVESIWETHHALILPSRFEGLPISLVEAMLCARPCIVTDIGGNSEVIDDGINGFIAIAPKVECIDDALERAWQQRDALREIGQSAGVKIRQIIPRDPIAVFVDELKVLLSR